MQFGGRLPEEMKQLPKRYLQNLNGKVPEGRRQNFPLYPGPPPLFSALVVSPQSNERLMDLSSLEPTELWVSNAGTGSDC